MAEQKSRSEFPVERARALKPERLAHAAKATYEDAGEVLQMTATLVDRGVGEGRGEVGLAIHRLYTAGELQAQAKRLGLDWGGDIPTTKSSFVGALLLKVGAIDRPILTARVRAATSLLDRYGKAFARREGFKWGAKPGDSRGRPAAETGTVAGVTVRVKTDSGWTSLSVSGAVANRDRAPEEYRKVLEGIKDALGAVGASDFVMMVLERIPELRAKIAATLARRAAAVK